MVMTFLLFEAPPSEAVTLHLGAIMKDNKFPKTLHKRKRVNAQQYSMVYNQETKLMKIADLS